MKKQLIIGIVTILIIVGLSGCNSTEKTNNQNTNRSQLIIGTWYHDFTETRSIFYENGSTCTFLDNTTFWAKYNLTENQIIMTTPENEISNNTYVFSNDGNTLTITNPRGTYIFHRQ